MKDFEFDISPVETYRPPDIPTLSDDNPTLLKKLPKRWQKKAKVIACMGLIGVFAFSGGGFMVSFSDRHTTRARTVRVAYEGYSRAELAIRIHVGGAGGAGYVVYLTEQEMLGIIRSRLEAAGLDFSAEPSGYTFSGGTSIRHGWEPVDVGFDLFDEQKSVAIATLDFNTRSVFGWTRENAMAVERGFAQQTDTTVGAFYTLSAFPDTPLFWTGNLFVGRRVSRREAASHIPALKANLHSQVDTFIALLQFDGILERPAEICVMVNGKRVEFDLFPVFVNNQVMVSSPEIFEALEMEIESRDAMNRVTVTKDDISIRISRHSILIDDDWENWIDMSASTFMYGDIIMIPLQYLAEAIGANAEWDEGMTTIKITTN